MANDSEANNQGQSSRSECVIEIVLSMFEFFFSDVRKFGYPSFSNARFRGLWRYVGDKKTMTPLIWTLPGGPPEIFHSEFDLPGPNHPSVHDIKIKFHPNSHRPNQHIPHNGYHPVNGPPAAGSPDPPILETPWYPFRSRLDFEVAEFALSSHLNKTETDTLLSIIQRCIKDPEQHTLKDHKEIMEYWDLAKTKTTGVCKSHQSKPRLLDLVCTTCNMISTVWKKNDICPISKRRNEVRCMDKTALDLVWGPPQQRGNCIQVSMGCAADIQT